MNRRTIIARVSKGRADGRQSPKMLKPALALLLLAALLLGAPGALAGTAAVPEYGLAVNFPPSLDLFTRNMAENDPLLSLYGRQAADVSQELRSAGLYARAYDIAGEFTLDLAVTGGGGDAIESMDEAALAALAAQLGGGQYERFQAMRGSGLMVYMSDGRGLTCLLRANGTQLELRLRAGSRVTSRMAELARGIAASVDLGAGQ